MTTLSSKVETPDSAELSDPTQSVQDERPLSSATAYALGYGVQRIVGFVMLPIYTRVISPAEYGVLSVLVSVATGAGVIFAAGLDLAIYRTYFELEDDPERQDHFIHSIWRFLVIFPTISAFALAALAWVVIGDHQYFTEFDVLLALLGSAMNIAATTLPLAVLRAKQALRPYLIVTAVTTAVAPLCGVIFVVVLGTGLRGFLLAGLIANVATLIAAGVVMPWRRHITFQRKLVSKALKFSVPLVPHFFSHWALQVADRLVIAGLVSATSLGLYGLGSNVAAPFMMAVLSLNAGFMPTYAKAGTKGGLGAALREAVVLQIALVVTITLGGMLLGSSVVEIMAPPSYHGAGSLVAWIVLGYGFLGLYYIPMNGATLGAGRSRYAWTATLASACVNISLLFFFVPTYGVHFAAVASALGYLVLLILIAIYAHARPNPVSYEWGRIVPLFLAAGLIYAAAMATTPGDPIAALLLRTLWLGGFAGLLIAFGVVSVPWSSLRGRIFPAS